MQVLSKSQIDNTPLKPKYIEVSFDPDEESVEECSVCYMSMYDTGSPCNSCMWYGECEEHVQNVWTTPCGHPICTECISAIGERDMLYGTMKECLCPICRSDISQWAKVAY